MAAHAHLECRVVEELSCRYLQLGTSGFKRYYVAHQLDESDATGPATTVAPDWTVVRDGPQLKRGITPRLSRSERWRGEL